MHNLKVYGAHQDFLNKYIDVHTHNECLFQSLSIAVRLHSKIRANPIDVEMELFATKNL